MDAESQRSVAGTRVVPLAIDVIATAQGLHYGVVEVGALDFYWDDSHARIIHATAAFALQTKAAIPQPCNPKLHPRPRGLSVG